MSLEPALRMAVGHIYHAKLYMERVPDLKDNASLHRAFKDLSEAQDRIRNYAVKHGIDLRETMKT